MCYTDSCWSYKWHYQFVIYMIVNHVQWHIMFWKTQWQCRSKITIIGLLSWRFCSQWWPDNTSESTTFSGCAHSGGITLQWRHNGCDGIPNHQPHGCLLKCLFGRRSKETSKLRVTGLCAGSHRWSVNCPHRWPLTQKMFPFDDIIMRSCNLVKPWDKG